MSNERPARHSLAQAIRQLASGTLTNDEFERDAVPDRQDEGAYQVYLFVWGHYDDFVKHRLRGDRRLSPFQRQVFARCVLFLRSGLPYEWPSHAKWMWCPQRMKEEPARRLPWWKPDETVLDAMPFWNWLTREQRRKREDAADRRLKARTIVDDRIWPFRRRSDYEAALSNPPYLCGTCSA